MKKLIVLLAVAMLFIMTGCVTPTSPSTDGNVVTINQENINGLFVLVNSYEHITEFTNDVSGDSDDQTYTFDLDTDKSEMMWFHLKQDRLTVYNNQSISDIDLINIYSDGSLASTYTVTETEITFDNEVNTRYWEIQKDIPYTIVYTEGDTVTLTQTHYGYGYETTVATKPTVDEYVMVEIEMTFVLQDETLID